MRTLSQTFRSIKRPISNPKLSKCSSSSPKKSELKPKSESSSWCVYLILSTNHPIKTYVGVTTNFPRRLKEHNGDLKGGAKASRAGRPWICACIVCGFTNRSEACVFESKWKALSRRVPRKKQNDDSSKQSESEDPSRPLLQHRQAALNRVKTSLDCTNLEINWHLDPI
ncbi:putative GIY-YIG nuclease superfamily [Medicago truncatula]|uniref:Putative GIY-YIG nuclease superfamily n=1 Tax=Medicago truncatula TaxID=3880 RepID=A0A072TLC3_MEDTR|nr:structure-specific endonuclease subunit slx1 isoform X1 [Medicago truncatula]KEH17663.1 structure-specific endonuclease subunit SLX1-like protein [Medicago truncatula]RHN60000.1 putative GIY-YIG nuclease superfamily [Medicago truncatula]